MDEIHRDRKLSKFPEFEDDPELSDFDSADVWTFRLADCGRPRAVDAELLLVLVVINGVFSLTSRQGYERLIESELFNVLLEGRAVGFPARSTIGKYLEIPSERTLELIHKTLYRKVKEEELDDFTDLTVDSTGIEANSAWPTESGLIFGFLNRIDRLLEKQTVYTGVAYKSKLVKRWLGELEKLHSKISLLPVKPGCRARRKKLYRSVLITADKTRRKLQELLGRRHKKISLVSRIHGLNLVPATCRVDETKLFSALPWFESRRIF